MSVPTAAVLCTYDCCGAQRLLCICSAAFVGLGINVLPGHVTCGVLNSLWLPCVLLQAILLLHCAVVAVLSDHCLTDH